MERNEKKLIIKGAREHNLKDIDVEIPRDKFVVITGLSGSGKSSLAFDTIYAEGQRRYVESLSSYARQFLGQMEKPDVSYIEGLSPAISIDQKTTNRNPRSTVGTVTEIYDYLRLLYARVGIPHCAVCRQEISPSSVDLIVDSIMKMPDKTKLQILSPIVRGKKGTHTKVFEMLLRDGYIRCRVNGEILELGTETELEKNKKHSIEAVVDRIVLTDDIETRLADSVESALKLSEGTVIICDIESGEEKLYNTNFACPEHGPGITEMEPRYFSFNAPYGACPECSGLGQMKYVDEKLVVPNPEKSIADGALAIALKNTNDSFYSVVIKALLKKEKATMDTPFNQLPESLRSKLLYGTGTEKVKYIYDSRFSGLKEFSRPFEGIIPNMERRYRDTNSDAARQYIENFMTEVDCHECAGRRLKPEVLAVTVAGLNIHEMTSKSVAELTDFFKDLKLGGHHMAIAEQIRMEIHQRLKFLHDVGLGYLTLSRAAFTLSGGESQRIRLATQIGSGLVGVMYILDEPSIGLHQKDNQKLIGALRSLSEAGNTLIVVEHDEETISQADYILDLGPGAGEHGGEIVAAGTPKEIMKNKKSITGQYLSGTKKIEIPETRRSAKNGEFIKIKKARANNLKSINVEIPLGVLTVVTGVSGSGKSSLINEVLQKEVMRSIYKSRVRPGAHGGIEGLDLLDKIIDIDQSPIGRTPRSNPATYTGVFDHIRNLFAETRDAKRMGYKKGRFSFNVSGGRCEHCRGDGIKKIEMHFLPDIYVQCDVCKGRRYNRETLAVRYKGKSISEVLEMTAEQALKFFENIRTIKRILQTISDVGLGYIKLGQPSPQLSGGEAQRMKLASELSKVGTGNTLYILDEPTTGLHAADVHTLIQVLQRLVDSGNTVVVIEHNLDIIKSADHIIDLGPDGGDGGGTVVAVGTPESLSKSKKSYTGEYLKRILG